MVTVLITSFLLLAAIIYVVYRRQESPPRLKARQGESLPPPSASGWGGLFAEETASQQKQLDEEAATAERERSRADILARAFAGERSALADAHSFGDEGFYDEVLNALLKEADSDKKVLALVSYMLRETPPLRVNRPLAERFMEAWKPAPDRGSTAKMLHISALANDAALYRKTVETALEYWRQNRIQGLSAEELCSLCESEYWVLSQNERGSGRGFLLKLKLAALRRELARGANIGG
ncbi:MAG TPA: hypothetical protein VJS44_19410 [Pyrinomonadaceae bacterium]|nr:hypothetical protein [Pyrinomonadaceae bacterium]